MKIKITKYIFAIWFSILLLVGNTPMEFIHLFSDHKDTVHNTHKGLVIENKHHHCAFLSLTLTSFVNDFEVPFICLTSVQHFIRYADVASEFTIERIVSVSLRGPPTV